MAAASGRSSLNPGTPDTWSGGTGNWSVAGNWNNGEPGANSDVTIYSGGSDYLSLDVGSTTINSLTLGGVANGFNSQLSDAGTNQTLNITNALNVGQNGYLQLTGATSTLTAGADSVNAGQIYLYNGASLTINGNFDNKYVVQAENGTSEINVSGTLTNES